MNEVSERVKKLRYAATTKEGMIYIICVSVTLAVGQTFSSMQQFTWNNYSLCLFFLRVLIKLTINRIIQETNSLNWNFL